MKWSKCVNLYVLDKTDVISILIQNGADVNAQNTDGNTGLHSAAALGMANVVQCLVENGADINVKNAKDQSALDLAEKFDNPGVAEILRQVREQQMSR